MNGMILAAGRGERLRPYTDHCPKPLFEVRGRPLIEYHLRAFAAAGIVNVVINTSWLGEMIESRVGDGSRFGLEIVYSRETEALETAGGIVQALALLDDRFIVVNGDIFTDYPIARLAGCETGPHLVLVENPPHNPGGDFSLAGGRVGNNANDRYTFAGIACYRKSFFEGLSPGKRALAPLLRQAADRGELGAELYSGIWADVGTEERWREVGGE